MNLPSRSRFPPWPPFTVLAAAAAYLTLRWDAIPPRWVIHWDAAGRPNGYASRTVLGVFGPLLLGVALLVLIEWLATAARPPGAESFAWESLRAATQDLMRAVCLAIALIFAALAVTLPLGPHLPAGVIVLLALGLILVAVFLGAGRVSQALRGMRRSGHAAKVEGYHALYYSNANDPRLWVTKLSGIGLTINFAHRWAWPIMVLLLALPVAVAVLSIVAAREH